MAMMKNEEAHSSGQNATTKNECCEVQAKRSQRKKRKYETYNYETLPRKRGAIRVLKLLSSNPQNPEVECELLMQGEEGVAPIAYEALSWCWGTDPAQKYINIRQRQKVYVKNVSENLFAALKALRYEDRDRYLWVDAVCIDQEDMNEKNHQVEMMYEIYGNAVNVCIWLGEPSESSCLALRFIQEEVLQLRDFDELCERRDVSKKWHALLELMQRPWFSRRWVVQEIALARKAVVYCGQHSIAWHEFAIAVELFVEVETATHRLSEVMRKDSKDKHVPGLFDHVSALGASLLVDATDRLFRDYKQEHNTTLVDSERDYESESDSNSEDEEFEDENAVLTPTESESLNQRSVQPIKTKNNMRPLLSLEYLVSSLSIFDTTAPHDTIYSLLAIAKDTTPKAARGWADLPGSSDYVREGLEVFTQRKRYNVNYELPYVDVCREFIEFAIERSLQIDPSRALDVICRPWATEQKLLDAKRFQSEQAEKKRERAELIKEDRKQRRIPRNSVQTAKANSTLKGNMGMTDKDEEKLKRKMQDMKLPSWIPQLSSAPFAMYQKAGLSGPKMSRKNADPLVGLPSTTRKVYSAAETKKVDMKALKFRKRADLEPSHFSMYVRGFRVDTIEEVEQVSQNGQIPREWTDLAGWENTQRKAPPEAFWRTLVADRGLNGNNPPVYYSSACAESFKKGGYESGAVNTSDLINHERNSVVSQFCRRVQAVVWNRALVKTKRGALGLVGKDVRKGDKVCILYGLSVPVILRQKKKKQDSEFDKEMDWELVYIKKKIQHCFKQYKARKREHESRKDREMLPLLKQWFKEEKSKWRFVKHEIDRLEEARSKRCKRDRLLWEHELKDAVHESLHVALTAFSEWRETRRKVEWEDLEKKGLVGDVNARKAKDARPRCYFTPRTRRLSEVQTNPRSISRGRERDKPFVPARPPNPSKDRNAAQKNSEANKTTIDWWGFEYALKAGRRWRRLVKLRKECMEKELKTAVEREWLRRREEEFASFKTKRMHEKKWEYLDSERPRHLDILKPKMPTRSHTHAPRSPGPTPAVREDPKKWNKYGSREFLDSGAQQLPNSSKDTRAGADVSLRDRDNKAPERKREVSPPPQGSGSARKHIPGPMSMNDHRLSVEEPDFHPLSPVQEEPFDLAMENSNPTMQRASEPVENPVEDGDLYDDDDPDNGIPPSHEIQNSVATLIDGSSRVATNISDSPEQTHATLATKDPSPIPDEEVPELHLSPSRQQTVVSPDSEAPPAVPKIPHQATPPEPSPQSVYRASWHPPRQPYDTLSDQEGEQLVGRMKEWLRENIFKKDGYYWHELLGECYIHGIMDGEAMLLQNEGYEGDEKDEQGGLRHIPSEVYEIR